MRNKLHMVIHVGLSDVNVYKPANKVRRSTEEDNEKIKPDNMHKNLTT